MNKTTHTEPWPARIVITSHGKVTHICCCCPKCAARTSLCGRDTQGHQLHLDDGNLCKSCHKRRFDPLEQAKHVAKRRHKRGQG